MSGFSPVNYALQVAGDARVAAGIDHYEVDGLTLKIFPKKGPMLTMTFPEPKGMEPILEKILTATVTVGGVANGKVFPAGTKLEEVLTAILTVDAKPVVTIGISPTKVLYDAVEDELSTLQISANVTKKTYPITKVEFIIGNTVVNTVTTGVTDGGVFKYTHTFDPVQKETFVPQVRVTDEKGNVVIAKTTVTFVAPSFYGMIEDGLEFNEENIKALENKELKTKKDLTYSDITSPSADKAYRITYCYPASFGSITSVTDAMNFEYIQDYVVSSITMDEIEYILMHEKDAGYVADYLQKFK